MVKLTFFTNTSDDCMARLPRLNPPGVAQHIIQRGNNRHICFAEEDDYTRYLEWLNKYSKKYGMDLHAFVLITNHVHLLSTPQSEESIPKTLQSLGRQYVRYFNDRYRRSGTLWEGRYKSCLVQSERYLLMCHRYIELNPVRAGMVDRPEAYRWSSYSSNAMGKRGLNLTPHPEYMRLGGSTEDRCASYRALFATAENDVMIKEIRDAVNKGFALGSEKFKDEIETNLQRRVRPAPMGRPRKSPKRSQKVYSDP